MKLNKLKKRLEEGKVALGPFLKLGEPAVVEIAGLAGFDFVVIDTEHGPFTAETAQDLVRAAEIRDITPIIRVSENNPSLMQRALDVGAQGVQVPQVCKKEDAERVVKSARFFPKGERGVCGFVRAAGYSTVNPKEYFETSNEQNLIIVHIEGVSGIDNLPEILKVEGLDIIFLGPYDLSQSCGVPGEVTHPTVVKKMEEAVKLAKEENKFVGTFVTSVEGAKKWIDMGVQYISYSTDSTILVNAFTDIVKGVKG